MGVGALVGAVVGGATFAAGSAFFGATLASSVLMGAALGHSFDNRNRDLGTQSPTYSFGDLQNTARRDLPVPIIYGRVRVAGNVIDHAQGNGWTSHLTDPGGNSTTVLNVRLSMLCKYRATQGFPGGVDVTWRYRIRYRAAGDSEWTEQSYTRTVDGGGTTTTSGTERERTAQFDHPINVPPGNYQIQVLYDRVSLNNSGWSILSHRLRVERWSHTTGGITTTQNVRQNLQTEDGATQLTMAVGIGEGRVHSITDIRANGIPIGEIKGARWTRYYGTADQDYDEKVVGGERFKHTAYIAASFEANDQINSIPTITATVEGLEVRVWNGSQWVTQFSRNPAWCLLDFLTNSRYGIGIPDDRIDLASFISEAEYCDQLVPDGAGGTEPRFCLDYVIDTQRSSLDVIEEILSTFRAFLVYSEGKIRLQIERSAPVVHAFTMDNIIADSFVYSKASYKDLPNRMRVEWIDPDGEWQRVESIYDNEIDQDKRGEVYSRMISLLGVTRPGQAGRMARFYLDSAFWANTFCEFRVGIDALACEVGDVVSVSHDVPGWENKLFRVLEIAEEENDEMVLRCREYVSAIYHDRGSQWQPGSQTVLPSPLTPPPHVSNVALQSITKMLGDGTIVPAIRVTWAEPNDVQYLRSRVYWREGGTGGWTFAGSSEAPMFDIELAEPGSYEILVQSENRNRVRADFDTAPVATIMISSVIPGNVTGLQADFNGPDAVVSWNAVPHAYRYRVQIIDLNTDDVRRTEEIAGTSYVYTYAKNVMDFGGSGKPEFKVSVEARNEYGNYSATPAVLQVSNPPPEQPEVSVRSDRAEIRWAVTSKVAPVWATTTVQAGGFSQTAPVLNGVIDAEEAGFADGDLATIGVYTTDIFGRNSLTTTSQTTVKMIDKLAFVQGLRPVELVSALPQLPNPEYPEGSVVFLTTDHKLYRSTGTEWTSEVDSEDLAANSVTAGKIAAGAVTADAIGANEVITQAANIGSAVIKNAHVDELSADKVKGGTMRLTGDMAIENEDGSIRIDPTKIEAIDSNTEEVTFQLLVAVGSAFFRGSVRAGELILPVEPI